MNIIKKFILEKFVLNRPFKFKYSSILLKINDPYINHIKRLQQIFKSDHLYKFGIEKDIHITVLYGIKTHTEEHIRNVFNNLNIKPFVIDITDIILFQNESDVIVLKCKSEELNKLRKTLENNFSFQKTHKEFIPHITLAYVKPGLGELYKRLLKYKFKPHKIKIDRIYFSDKNGKLFEYKLER